MKNEGAGEEMKKGEGKKEKIGKGQERAMIEMYYEYPWAEF